MKKAKKVTLSCLGIFVATLIVYLVDNAKTFTNVQNASERALKETLTNLVDTSPAELTYLAPKNEQSQIFTTVTTMDSKSTFRVINVEDSWIQTSAYKNMLMIIDTNPDEPVYKVEDLSLSNFDDEHIYAHADIQYVDPLGIVRSLGIDMAVPLHHY